MRFIGETNIPFLKYRWIAIGASCLVILGGLGYQLLGGGGLNLGIDFVGGTQVTVKFREQPDIPRLRDALSRISAGESQIQRFDEPEKQEIMIRVQNPQSAEGDMTRPIIELLKSEFDSGGSDRFDLNLQGAQELSGLLARLDPEGVAGDEEGRRMHYAAMADAVLELRKRVGIFASLDDLDQIEELPVGVRAALKDHARVGAFALLGAESVGPTVGRDLQEKARMAMLFSTIGMLIYIWIRFQLPYGVGAVVAMIHDVLVTLVALAVTGREVNLPTIAALLTLVGYSVNDTVVIFDRVRENLKLRRGERLQSIMDLSMNQMLSRTIITSGLTLVVVITLYIFGGDVINTFAFVLLVGLIAGSYSTIFIASPVALAITRLLAARRERRRRR